MECLSPTSFKAIMPSGNSWRRIMSYLMEWATRGRQIPIWGHFGLRPKAWVGFLSSPGVLRFQIISLAQSQKASWMKHAEIKRISKILPLYGLEAFHFPVGLKKLISAHSQNHWNVKLSALKTQNLQLGTLFFSPGNFWGDGEIEPFLQFLAPTKNL